MPRRPAHVLLCLAAVALLTYYLLTPAAIFGSKAQGDGFFSFHYLPNLVVYRSLDMRHTLPGQLDAMDTGPRGHKLNRAPIGPALAMLPVYCLGESAKLAAVSVLRALGRPRGLGPPPFVPHTGQMLYTGLVTLAAGIFGMLVTYRLLRRYFARGAAAAGALSAVLLTPQLWYLTVQPHYQHGLAFAAVALLLWRWDRGRGELAGRRFFLLGVLGGVAMLMRAQEAVFLLAPAGELLVALLAALRPIQGPRVRRVLLCGALLAIGALLGFLPQLAVWGQYFGWFVRPPNVERLRPLEPAIAEVLWSLRAGLFAWTPVAYLGIAGLLLGIAAPRGPGALRGLLVTALLVLCADVYLVASSWVWYGGFSFGARRLSDCAGLLGLGVAVLWARVFDGPRRHRLLAGGLLMGLLALFGLNAALVELVRQRRLPDSGAAATPAFRLAERAGGPAWLVALLRHGYPFAQPAGLLFALRHHAPITAWESVVGNYALEQEAHDLSLTGVRWDFTGPQAERFVVQGLLPDATPMPADERGRPVGPRVRALLQAFTTTAIDATLEGDLPASGLTVRWNGQALPSRLQGQQARFTIPAALLTTHAVGELELLFVLGPATPPARLRTLTLALAAPARRD